MTMRSILSLGLTALAASTASADTTIAVLEFGPGGSVHRTTTSYTRSNSAAVASFWDAMHRPASRGSMVQHAGMSVVPDLFKAADAGIVIGLRGESVKAMPTATSMLDSAEGNVVGHMYVPGQAGADLMERAASEDVKKEDMSSRLQSTAETAARGESKGMETLSLTVDNDATAAVADAEISRMLKILKKEAAIHGKTVVVHLVVEEEGASRRRLDEGEDGQNQNNQNNNNAYSNQKSMYEIQTFNLYLWTAVGLVVIVFSVMSTFIAMPLFPDTLLYGEAGKMGGSD